MSNYARLIQMEGVYKERIRQLEAENTSLKEHVRELYECSDGEIIDVEVIP